MSVQPGVKQAAVDGDSNMTVDIVQQVVDNISAGTVSREAESKSRIVATSAVTLTANNNAVSRPITVPTSNNVNNISFAKDPFKDNIQEIKKSLTLDLGGRESAKKQLTTPELLSMIRFTSPDLEKLFTQAMTPSVSINTPTPTSYFYPKNVTAEQEQYARGFIDALNQIHLLRGSCFPNLLSPGFVTTTIQQADRDELNKLRESSVEQLLRTWANSASFPSLTPSTVGITLSNALSAAAACSTTAALQQQEQQNPATISIPVKPVIFPTTLSNSISNINQLSVITGGSGGGVISSNSSDSGVYSNAATMLLKAQVEHQHQQQQQHQDESSRSTSSPCVSPNSSTHSMTADSLSSAYASPAAMLMTQQQKILSKNSNAAATTAVVNCGGPSTFGGLLVPGNMLPTAHFITLPSSSGSVGGLSPRQQQQTSGGGSNAIVNVNNIATILRNNIKTENVGGRHQRHLVINKSVHGNSSSVNSNNSVTTTAAGNHVLPGISVSVTGVDPNTQERMKLERKRARNRVAATKCRKRKIERINNLDDKVKELVKQNDDIEDKISMCKQDVERLRQLVKEHQMRGCNVQMI